PLADGRAGRRRRRAADAGGAGGGGRLAVAAHESPDPDADGDDGGHRQPAADEHDVRAAALLLLLRLLGSVLLDGGLLDHEAVLALGAVDLAADQPRVADRDHRLAAGTLLLETRACRHEVTPASSCVLWSREGTTNLHAPSGSTG